jgi:hypothetical protein
MKKTIMFLMGFVLLFTYAADAQRTTRTNSTPSTLQYNEALYNGIEWRGIGPFRGGRSAAVAGVPGKPNLYYFGATGGGVWRTTDAGTTYENISDGFFGGSIGAVAVSEWDPNVIYVGGGEKTVRGNVSYGYGMYKSVDAGKTWKSIGLPESRHIARVRIHPRNPDLVYVAVMGDLFKSSTERGVYKSTDGGATWRKVLFANADAGAVDLTFDPNNPRILYASTWRIRRTPYSLESGGDGSAMWKSTDAGETWTEVKGGGLPESQKGRIEIAISPSQPDVMYLQLEADTVRGAGMTRRPSGLYRSADGGRTWEYRNPENVRPFYYSQVRVHPTNPDRVWWSSTPVKYSRDGGRTAGNATVGLHVDHHAMWIDPKDPERMIVGNDGGLGISFDGGGNYIFPNTFALGQFYNISVDMAVPYMVCGGLQDNGSWCGPSRRRQGAITNAMWHNVGGGDGFVTQQDWSDPRILYSTSQGGNMGRFDYALGRRTALRKPTWRRVGRRPRARRTASSRRAPDPRHTVGVKAALVRDQCELLFQRLRDQHAVEGITHRIAEPTGRLRVGGFDGQQFEALTAYRSEQVDSGLHRQR